MIGTDFWWFGFRRMGGGGGAAGVAHWASCVDVLWRLRNEVVNVAHFRRVCASVWTGCEGRAALRIGSLRRLRVQLGAPHGVAGDHLVGAELRDPKPVGPGGGGAGWPFGGVADIDIASDH